MFNEILPFWAKYWVHVILGLVSCAILKVFLNRFGSGATENNAGFSKTSVTAANWHEDSEEDDGKADDQEEPALPKDLEHVPYAYEKPSTAELLRRACEFYQIANARRTLRFFSPEPVPKSVIHEIIKAAGTAPSGAHTEPWTFVAISSQETKSEIRRIVELEEEINYKKRMGVKWTTDLLPLRTNWVKEYLTVAPYLILVFKQTHGYLPNGKRKVHYYNETSVAIACGILITAIQYAGLVTLTSTPLNCGPAIRKLLDRPVNEKLMLLLPVGYPAENATVPALRRKELSEILVEVD